MFEIEKQKQNAYMHNNKKGWELEITELMFSHVSQTETEFTIQHL